MDVEAEFWKLCDGAARFDESSSRKLRDDTCSADEVWDDDRAAERAMVKITAGMQSAKGRPVADKRCQQSFCCWIGEWAAADSSRHLFKA